jgi:hypothetical protein
MAGTDWLANLGYQPVNPAQALDAMNMETNPVPPALSQVLTPEQLAEMRRKQQLKRQNAVIMSGPPPQQPMQPDPGLSQMPAADASGLIPPQLQAEALVDKNDAKRRMAEQDAALEALKMRAQEFQGMPSQTNMSPLAALADSWTGSHLAPVAKEIAGMSPEEKAVMATKLQDMIQGRQGDLTKEAVALANQSNTNKLTGALLGQSRIESTAQREFKRVADNPMITQQLGQHQQAAKDLGLINDSIVNQKPMPLQTLDEITQGLGNLVVIAKNTTGGEREAQRYHNLQSSILEKLNAARTSGVNEIYDPQMFQQLHDQIQRLHDVNEQLLKNQIDKQMRPTQNQYMDQQQKAARQNLYNQLEQNNAGFKKAKGQSAPPAIDHDAINEELQRRLSQ